MQFVDNIPVFGTIIDDGALRQIKTCAQTADKVALMADHHNGNGGRITRLAPRVY